MAHAIEMVGLLVTIACIALVHCGCGGAIHDASTRATEAAIDALDDPKYKKELDDMAAEAAGAARDKALDADTTAKLVALRDAMLDEKLHVEVAGLREELLGTRTQALGLALIDGSLVTLDARADSLREHLFGQPLRDDLDAFAAEAQAKAPGIAQAAAAGATVTVNAEMGRAEHVAMWVGAALLVLLLVVQVITHRKLAAALAARQESR